jgi:hypothetical protein
MLIRIQFWNKINVEYILSLLTQDCLFFSVVVLDLYLILSSVLFYEIVEHLYMTS